LFFTVTGNEKCATVSRFLIGNTKIIKTIRFS
jgi:hypothetical protein